MRADCQLVIDPLDLDRAIYFLSETGAAAGVRDADIDDIYTIPSDIALRPASGGVLVATEAGDVELPGVGKWSRHVGVDGYRLAVLANRLKGAGKVRLLFAADLLFLGATGIDAWEEPPTIAVEHVGPGWQTLLPGMAAVTEADRLMHRAQQPLRPRVGQRPPPRDGLFGGG